jgi:carboxypeptidase PM20D1
MNGIIILLSIAAMALLAIIIIRALLCKKIKTERGDQIKVAFNEASAIQRLSQIIQFETISINPGEITNPVAFTKLHEFLRQTYPQLFERVEMQKFGEFALLLKWQGSDNFMDPLMLIAHQDVVPVPKAECEHWQFPPFSGAVADGYIWGRGALDMKSTLIAILEATTQLISENIQPKRTIYIYLGDDEEVGGPTAKKAAAWFQAQKIKLSYIIDEGGAILDKMVPGINQPICLIGIGQKGALNLELSVSGQSGHAAQPPRSTPIDILGSAVAKVKKNEMPIHADSLVFPLFCRLAPYMPFAQRLIMANQWFFKPLLTWKLAKIPLMNAMMRTTAAPTIFNAGFKQNVIPEVASANINYRLYPGDTRVKVVKHVEAILQNSGVSIKVLDDFNGSTISKTNSFGYKMISKTIQQISDANVIVAPVLTIGSTDSRHFEALTQHVYQFLFIRGTMDDFKCYHGMNERISIKNFLNSVNFYYQLIQNSQMADNEMREIK